MLWLSTRCDDRLLLWFFSHVVWCKELLSIVIEIGFGFPGISPRFDIELKYPFFTTVPIFDDSVSVRFPWLFRTGLIFLGLGLPPPAPGICFLVDDLQIMAWTLFGDLDFLIFPLSINFSK